LGGAAAEGEDDAFGGEPASPAVELTSAGVDVDVAGAGALAVGCGPPHPSKDIAISERRSAFERITAGG
jgi:hypothetical protein